MVIPVMEIHTEQVDMAAHMEMVHMVQAVTETATAVEERLMMSQIRLADSMAALDRLVGSAVIPAEDREEYDPNDQDSRYFQAARNYLRSGSYEEARTVLNQIQDHNAKWHYYSGVCNAGLGNQIRALEMLQRAIQLEPDNMEYKQAYEQIKSGSKWYMDQGQGYGMDMSGRDMTKCCNTFCTTLLCLSCCGGNMCCFPCGGYYSGGY